MVKVVKRMVVMIVVKGCLRMRKVRKVSILFENWTKFPYFFEASFWSWYLIELSSFDEIGDSRVALVRGNLFGHPLRIFSSMFWRYINMNLILSIWLREVIEYCYRNVVKVKFVILINDNQLKFKLKGWLWQLLCKCWQWYVIIN